MPTLKITKKLDRAFQWAGEKMGAEAKTAHSDEFRVLETEMALRIDGMDKMQKSMNAYVKWVTRRSEAVDDKEKSLPASYLGRTMCTHGEDFEPDSEFGNCLITMGRTNERVAGLQEQYAADMTATWLESLNRSMAMMKEYQTARKKLESRRLAYDTSLVKSQKARPDDFRADEDVRTSRAKFEESNDDVLRRMQDIKENETDSIRELTGFLDAQLDFHERCVEELRRARDGWNGNRAAVRTSPTRQISSRARSNTTQSYSERPSPRATRNGNGNGNGNGYGGYYDEEEPEPEPVRMPLRSSRGPPPEPPRPGLGRSATSPVVSSFPNDRRTASQPLGNMMRSSLRPVNRIDTDAHPTAGRHYTHQRGGCHGGDDVFADRDDDETPQSENSSPKWGNGDRCTSPATSLGSWSRSTTGSSMRKAPPPPPPCRSKKPAPPIPPKREAWS